MLVTTKIGWTSSGSGVSRKTRCVRGRRPRQHATKFKSRLEGRSPKDQLELIRPVVGVPKKVPCSHVIQTVNNGQIIQTITEDRYNLEIHLPQQCDPGTLCYHHQALGREKTVH